jgi:hypothetical protein
MLAVFCGAAYWRSPLILASYLALGLHLMVLFSPLELGQAAGWMFKPFLGPKRAVLLALALVALVKIASNVSKQALEVQRVISKRAPDWPWRAKITLAGRALIRIARADSFELARTLASR